MRKVLEPFCLNGLQLKNRIARSATYSYMHNKDGFTGDDEIGIFETLAKNQIGLIISGQIYVNSDGKISGEEPGLDDDALIPGLRKLTDAVHSRGAKTIAQINHAGARSDLSVPLSPSEMKLPDGRVTRGLSAEEIRRIEEDFVSAARRAKEAGFDGVQVHAAHGYLLTEFLSPATNSRSDLYGGSLQNRFRIVEEILSGIRAECGTDFPVFVKINSNREDDAAYEAELRYFLNEFKAFGVTAVELSGYEWRAHKAGERSYYIRRAEKMRRLVDIPMMLVGGVRTLEDMEQVVDAGIDMVSLCRPFICEPDLIPRLIAGQEKSKCVSCSKCFGLYTQTGRRCILHA